MWGKPRNEKLYTYIYICMIIQFISYAFTSALSDFDYQQYERSDFGARQLASSLTILGSDPFYRCQLVQRINL